MRSQQIKKIDVRYDLWGEHPVHALGEIRGRTFQFRAENGKWELQIAGYHGMPADGDHTGYTYRGAFRGATLDEQQAVTIVESCLLEHSAATD